MFYRTRWVLRHCSFWLLVVPKDAASHRFTSFAEIENWLQNWIASKDESFFRDGIRKLPERWEKVLGSDGQYFNWSVHSFCFEINAQKTDRTNLYSQYINFREKEENTEQSSSEKNENYKKNFNFHLKAQLWGFKLSFHHFIIKIFYFLWEIILRFLFYSMWFFKYE